MKKISLLLFLSIFSAGLFHTEDAQARVRNNRRHSLKNMWKRNRAQFMGFFFTPAFNWIEKETMAASEIFKIVEREATLPDGSYLRGMYLGMPQYALASWQTKENTDQLSPNDEDDEIVFSENYPGGVRGQDTNPVTATDAMYWVVPCRAYITEPIRECIRFHVFLNWASPLYNSWIAAHAYAQVAAKATALRTLTEQKATDQQISWFLSRIEAFEEVNQWGYLVAMRHWQELVENWEVFYTKMGGLKSNEPKSFYNFLADQEEMVMQKYLGRPAEHDNYVIPWRGAWQNQRLNPRSMNLAVEWQQLSKFNQASPTELYPLWTNRNDANLENFLKRIRHRFLGKHTHVERLETYLKSPVYGKAAARIMDHYRKTLNEEVTRRGGKVIGTLNPTGKPNEKPKPVVTVSKSELLIAEAQQIVAQWNTDVRTLAQLKAQLQNAQGKGDRKRAEILEKMVNQEVRRLEALIPVIVERLEDIAEEIVAEGKLGNEANTQATTQTAQQLTEQAQRIEQSQF